MQYHYVVGYNTETNKWFVESDTTAYFSDGHVWDDERYNENFWGWFIPEEGTRDETLDHHLLNTLEYLVDTFPTRGKEV